MELIDIERNLFHIVSLAARYLGKNMLHGQVMIIITIILFKRHQYE